MRLAAAKLAPGRRAGRVADRELVRPELERHVLARARRAGDLDDQPRLVLEVGVAEAADEVRAPVLVAVDLAQERAAAAAAVAGDQQLGAARDVAHAQRAKARALAVDRVRARDDGREGRRRARGGRRGGAD